jgi:hypothetical protein
MILDSAAGQVQRERSHQHAPTTPSLECSVRSQHENGGMKMEKNGACSEDGTGAVNGP